MGGSPLDQQRTESNWFFHFGIEIVWSGSLWKSPCRFLIRPEASKDLPDSTPQQPIESLPIAGPVENSKDGFPEVGLLPNRSKARIRTGLRRPARNLNLSNDGANLPTPR